MSETLGNHHLRHHTKKIMVMLVIVILILAAGEYYLYRQQIQIKNMVSEGLMQLKEQVKSPSVPSPSLPAKK